MGGVLMDFHAGLELIGDELRKEYAGRYNEVPNIVSYLTPIKGAVEAMSALQQSGKYDVYILSTSPWSNPTTWSDKVEWVNRYLDKYYCKRLILSHHKNLLRGDYIIDDRGNMEQVASRENGFALEVKTFLIGTACLNIFK